ncbi:Aspartokinase [Yarrowia sp. C11]|nr:Aspartokinase [Yarrowia sp. E02]KAG5369482.1 Aspartokinase [Yarrowia sp. C11]
MTWIVQKFGGTSVGKFPKNICNDIVQQYSQSYDVAVVCSARSTGTKAEGTTTRLIAAADSALLGSDAYNPIIESIRSDHLAAAKRDVKNAELLENLNADVNGECDQLLRILAAAEIISEISPRTLDSIMAIGEKLSCMYMTAVMRDAGVNAKYFDLSHVVTTTNPEDPKFYADLGSVLGDIITLPGSPSSDSAPVKGNMVPVLTGFFGPVKGGLLSQIGRGYTDLCAALVAVGLGAKELQIWKEVDGVFTADPRKVSTARLLPIITPEEAAELTYYGSEVIHPFTMEQVIKAHIPIRIKNVENPLGGGTIIYPSADGSGNLKSKNNVQDLASSTDSLTSLSSGSFTPQVSAPVDDEKKPTAVTTKSNITVLNVHSNKRTKSHGFLNKIFATLDQQKLVVDLISTSEVHVSMAFHAPDSNLKQAVEELRKYGTVDVKRGMTIVSLIGTKMKAMVGCAGMFFSTLAQAGINIEMISQGANEINISCVIEEKDALKALNVIHQGLLCPRRKI